MATNPNINNLGYNLGPLSLDHCTWLSQHYDANTIATAAAAMATQKLMTSSLQHRLAVTSHPCMHAMGIPAQGTCNFPLPLHHHGNIPALVPGCNQGNIDNEFLLATTRVQSSKLVSTPTIARTHRENATITGVNSIK